MTDRVASVPPTASLSQAAAILSREQVRRLPVVEGRRIVGMVSLGDLKPPEETAMEAAEALSEITANVKAIVKKASPCGEPLVRCTLPDFS